MGDKIHAREEDAPYFSSLMFSFASPYSAFFFNQQIKFVRMKISTCSK